MGARKRELELDENETWLCRGNIGVSSDFCIDHEVVLRKLVPSWSSRTLCWTHDSGVHHAGDVVLLAKSMDAAQTMVSESIPELESTGQSVGAEKTHWTSFSRMELEGVGRHPFVRVLLSLSVARSIVMMSSESNCV